MDAVDGMDRVGCDNNRLSETVQPEEMKEVKEEREKQRAQRAKGK